MGNQKNKTIDECYRISKSYEKRKVSAKSYSYLLPHVYMGQQEKERALIRWLVSLAVNIEDIRLLEVGCGSGGNLLDLMRLGLNPENLVANELLEDRVTMARKMLPSSIKLVAGDATQADFQSECFDVVLQSTVFSSILDDAFQKDLATKMWEWVKPGGGVLWYDFIYDNPKNSDVRGVKIKRIRELFPEAVVTVQRVTLAPPLARIVTRLHPNLYTLFNVVPFLRTHVLCWIHKRF